jgi:A/G-specific adenine glycosylase
MTPKTFQQAVLSWFDQHGRKHLPWQDNKTHYRVWVSEIMLQQTQVTTVIPYFQRFMERFPTVHALAEAPNDIVLSHWSGLGYYARARNLHRATQHIVEHYDGHFPTTLEKAMELPGLGRSTASAILAIVDGQALPILDGNVKRVLARFAKTDPSWEVAERYMPSQRAGDYTQAMMDLGAMICTRTKPKCLLCPLQKGCKAYQDGEIDQYPAPKVKKTKSEKNAYFIWLEDQAGRVFLQQRPAKGLWGGLWVFPMVEFEEGVDHWIKQHLDKQKVTKTILPKRQHVFTHFKLHYGAVKVKLSTDTLPIEPGAWFNKDELNHIGLPVPVSLLLNG